MCTKFKKSQIFFYAFSTKGTGSKSGLRNSICEKAFELFSANLLFFDKERCAGMQNVHMLFDDLFRVSVGFVDDTLHFLINEGSGFLSVGTGVGQVSADEYTSSSPP